MLRLLKWVVSLFSPYVNSFERRVDKFFQSIKSTDGIAIIRDRLLQLMQRDLLVVNVWLEKKFKGYKYLSKKTRRKMYEDSKKIVKNFKDHKKLYTPNRNDIEDFLNEKKLLYPSGDDEKIKYIFQIMSFLRPGKYYRYIKTASFGKLLRDPEKEKLEGDCNQIVTLYIYLYSLKFPVSDLKIKLLPEHVCLHFRGIDIEATTAKVEKYVDCEQILPVTEIISTNLLDLTDFREDVQKISERVMVKSSQLAYAISSLKSLVTKNLHIAYTNLAVSSAKSKNFDSAIFFAEKANDRKLLNSIYKNAAIYYMDKYNFSKAHFYAQKSNAYEIMKSIKRNEAVYYFNKNKIDKALRVFTEINDKKMIKACYSKKYNELAVKTKNVKTVKQAKRHISKYKKMLQYAKKMDDDRLVRELRDILAKI